MIIQTFDRRNLLGQRRYYFRFVGRNGEKLAISEAYNSPASRDGTMGLVRLQAANATIQRK
jgi:uncharacterized protein YegP (UPF0339 family)